MLKVSDYRCGNTEYLYARKSGVLDKLEAVCGTDIKDLVLSYLSDSHTPVLYYWNAFCDGTIPEDIKARLRSEVDECINYTCTGKSSHTSIDFWDIKIQTNTLDDIKSQPITKLLAWIYNKRKKQEDLYRPAAIYEERGDIKTLITGFYQISTNKFIEATCDGILPNFICVMPNELMIRINELSETITDTVVACLYKKKYHHTNTPMPCYIRMINTGLDSICLSNLHMQTAIIYNNPFYIQKTNIITISYYYYLSNENKQLIKVHYEDDTLIIKRILPQKLDDLTPNLINEITFTIYYKFIDGRFHRYLKHVDNIKSKMYERTYYKVDLTNPTDDPLPVIEIAYTWIENSYYIDKHITVYYKDVKYLFMNNVNIKVEETTTVPIDDTCDFVITWNAAGYYDPPVVRRRE
jgi:hypothetical protein